MTYEEALALAYAQLPVFHRDGRSAIKPGLSNTLQFCEYLGNPQHRFKTIHVAGTNGKGSTSHMLAAILQCAGYRVGLYTSPHLKNFTERIRVNRAEMAEERVANFIESHQKEFLRLGLSFFELTVGMAFDEFAHQQVDVAVIETGLGGLLDSTNVINPVLSIITNVSYDHMDVLGETLQEIAIQKAGIIKPDTPVVISQRQEEVLHVFKGVAEQMKAPLFIAESHFKVKECTTQDGFLRITVHNDRPHDRSEETFFLDLIGHYQRLNLPGVLQACYVLNEHGFKLLNNHVQQGLRQTVALTGLKGRWQRIGERPLVFCDTGHNEAGMAAIVECIRSISYTQLWIVLGCVRDKDVRKLLLKLPMEANYVFTESKSPRALACLELQAKAKAFELLGPAIQDVNEALRYVRTHAQPNDLIVVCGSTYLVAELREI